MTVFQNPFRSRSAEHQRDTLTFLRNFGVGVLDYLPEGLWDRLFVIQSAPGGGKTSLLRLLTAESLNLVCERRADLPALFDKLTEIGAIDSGNPIRLGMRLELSRDYKSLDAVAPTEIAERLFFRLLDARIVVAFLRTVLAYVGGSFPDDTREITLSLRDVDRSGQAAARLGGLTGVELLSSAHQAESQIMSILDSLLPVTWPVGSVGHTDLYSLRLLSDADVEVGGQRLAQVPLLLLDDGHELAPRQRAGLLAQLRTRGLSIGRWYAERLEALTAGELVGGGSAEGRDHQVLELEVAARERGRQRGRFERLLIDIGNQRAASALERRGEERAFFDYVDVDEEELVGDRVHEVAATLQERVIREAGGSTRYQRWIDEAMRVRGYRGAVRWRELEVLIARDKARPMQELFEMELLTSEAERLSGSNVREAAALYLAREFRLPYYCGPETMAKLAFHNIDQFLSVCGDIFEEMLSQMTLQRVPQVGARRQHRILVRASQRLWRQLPERLPHGGDIQRLVASAVAVAQRDTFRPTAPYAPGVTGTALSMRDRAALMDPQYRAKLPGADRLFAALGSAIAHNVIQVEQDRSVKGDRYMVLYLNRLLCPHFWLPLGRGGFRERKLTEMAGWMIRAEPARIEIAEEPELSLIP